MKDRKKHTAEKITICALMTALVCVATIVIQIPIPLGYMHLGNTVILMTAYLLGPKSGAFAAGAGSALADLLTGFAIWCIPTLIIKGLMGFVIGYLAQSKSGELPRLFSAKTALAAVTGIAVMIFGYFIGGSILYGSVYTGALQIPGLAIEGAIGLGLFYVLTAMLEKAGIRKFLIGKRL